MEFKICTKCSINKPIIEFSMRKGSSKDGRRSYCKLCEKKMRRKYYVENRTKIAEKNRCNYIANKERKITQNKKWALNNPEKNKRYKRAWYLENKNRISLIYKDKYIQDKDKIIKQRREYYLQNKEAAKNRVKIYRLKNMQKIRNKKKEYENNRYRSDIFFNLKSRISRNFRARLRQFDVLKDGSMFSYTGILWSNYISHLQSDSLWSSFLKTPKSFHIDHIIPCSLYNFNDPAEIKKCYNPKNLRLLSSIDNNLKKDKLDMNLVVKYKIENLLPVAIFLREEK